MTIKKNKFQKELSVVVPAYNEEERLGGTLDEIAAYLRERKYSFEIIVVDDGSVDRTASVLDSVQKRIPEIKVIARRQNKGKGQSVKEGIALADKPLCLFMDADGATSIKEWRNFEKAFEAGADLVTASRHLPTSEIVHPQPAIRRILGSGYRWICRCFFGLKVSDFNCGFKAAKTDLAKEVYSKVRMKDWTFDVEALWLSKKLGFRHLEVPVRWEHHEKKSKIAPIRTAMATFVSIVRLKKRICSDGRNG